MMSMLPVMIHQSSALQPQSVPFGSAQSFHQISYGMVSILNQWVLVPHHQEIWKLPCCSSFLWGWLGANSQSQFHGQFHKPHLCYMGCKFHICEFSFIAFIIWVCHLRTVGTHQWNVVQSCMPLDRANSATWMGNASFISLSGSLLRYTCSDGTSWYYMWQMWQM